MKRKLLFLNAALAGALILAAAEWKVRYEQAAGRDRIFSALTAPKEAPKFPAPPAEKRLRQGDYLPIVRRHLFTKDRNAIIEVIVEPQAPIERPPLPVLGGLVDFGDGPLALMAADAAAEPAWVGAGEKVGEWSFDGVEGDMVRLTWNGETVEVDQAKLAGRVERKQPSRGGAAKRPPQSPQTADGASLSPAKPAGPGGKYNIGPEIRPGVNRADPSDTSPAGTESGGFVKEVRRTPFGTQSWWKKKSDSK